MIKFLFICCYGSVLNLIASFVGQENLGPV